MNPQSRFHIAHGGLAPLGRRDFLGLAAAGGIGLVGYAGAHAQDSASPAATGVATQGRRPNILVIVADDLGYGDLSVHGSTEIATPNIDSIAQGGVRFTQGYVSCPVCSPTRAGLITGRYQQRFGHEFNPGQVADHRTFGLPLSEVTAANILKSAGYATCMVGKWHLGFSPDRVPTARGFDEFFGFLSGSHSYVKLEPNGENSIFRGTEPVMEEEHLTDAFAREAVACIERHKDHPFFLYLTFNAVHNPLEPQPRYLDRFSAIADEKRRKYAALLTGLDDAVGQVLGKVREAGLESDTLVFFISDNGGPTANGSNNADLREIKGTVYEGGVRVPFFAQWKGHIPEGVTFDKPVISLDILPTAAAAAAATLPGDREIDGVNLLPFITGRNAAHPHEYLYWRFGEQSAIRNKDWKLVRNQGSEELFHLAADRTEKQDVLTEQPPIAEELRAAYAQWETNLIAPLWAQRVRTQARGNTRLTGD
ncbi:MAG: sulfatase-like hydrolase/transferase [Candidatus Hydrogenedentes bacterium]|nr:sulfatase-like hydrolase/transferase [Candidatus Hydrogenedentota bacterium]